MNAYERLNSEYRSGKGRYTKIHSADLAAVLNLIDAARTVDGMFKRAGVSGIIADWGPVSDCLNIITTDKKP